jgi:hypothetical protein
MVGVFVGGHAGIGRETDRARVLGLAAKRVTFVFHNSENRFSQF